MAQSKPNLLVIGGGFAGVVVATRASAFANVTLVDPKGYWEITWATVRGILDTKYAQQMTADFKEFPNMGKVVQSKVVRLSDKEAHLEGGEVVTFDYCAICSGSSYSDAFKSTSARNREQRLAELQALQGEIKAAKSIVVVGGGPSGVEVAAEIVNVFAGKAVTLVHPGKTLLSSSPAKAGARAQQWLEAHGVTVMLGSRVEGRPEGRGPATLTLSSGQSLAADLVLWCVGGRVNTAFMQPDLAGAVDDKGAIKVLPSLQVEGHLNMFALGDCNNVPETKKGFLAMKQGELAAASLQKLISAKKGSSPKLGAWKPNMGLDMMMVSLGDKSGVCIMGESSGCHGLAASMKAKDLFVAQTRKGLALK